MRVLFSLICCLSVIGCMATPPDTLITKSGLKYLQVQKGSGAKPVKGSSVKVNYIGKLQNGNVFESTYEVGTPIKFTVGNGEVIKGWEEGFQLMEEGEKGILIVPPALGYGKEGFKNPDDEKEYMIPPNATLIYEVELVKVK